MDNQIAELKEMIVKLRSDLDTLSGSFYKNNFTSTQTFNKDCTFTSRLRVPIYDSAPSVAEVGDLIAVAGELFICTTASTGGSGAVFTLVGSQA